MTENGKLTFLVLHLPRVSDPPPRQGHQHPHGRRGQGRRSHQQDQGLDWRHHVRQRLARMGHRHPRKGQLNRQRRHVTVWNANDEKATHRRLDDAQTT